MPSIRTLAPMRLGALSLLLALAACTTGAPLPPQAPAAPRVAPEQRLAAAIAAATGSDDRELAVQPLRDPEVQDLREAAGDAVRARDYAAAAESLNQALLIVADDPAVLQERAEVALLQGEDQRAETLATRAFELGSKVGPLCRRHWAVVEQARLARGLTQDAQSAHVQIAACTVAGLERM